MKDVAEKSKHKCMKDGLVSIQSKFLIKDSSASIKHLLSTICCTKLPPSNENDILVLFSSEAHYIPWRQKIQKTRNKVNIFYNFYLI